MESYLVIIALTLRYIWPLSLYSGDCVPSQLGFSKNSGQTLQVEQKGFGDVYCISMLWRTACLKYSLVAFFCYAVRLVAQYTKPKLSFSDCQIVNFKLSQHHFKLSNLEIIFFKFVLDHISSKMYIGNLYPESCSWALKVCRRVFRSGVGTVKNYPKNCSLQRKELRKCFRM